MMYFIENPFSSASSRDVVEAANFIGREHDIQRIMEKVILPPPEHKRASVAIIGLPDVGKRCLVNKILLECKADLHQRRLVPIEIDLTTYSESDKHDKFFRDLITLCKFELEDEDLAFATSQIPNLAQLTKDRLREWDEGARTLSTLKGFFKPIRRAVQVIFILNNFDHADSLFREHITRIQWLRDLAGTQCQVTWIALACKPIREIKMLPKSISDDFFVEHRLGMFVENDMAAYFRLLAQMGLSLTKEHEKRITAYCGRHPYLLSLLGYHLIEDYAHQSSSVDVDKTFRKVEKRFNQSYKRIIDLVLVNDGNDEKLQMLQKALFGSLADFEQEDIERMLAYNLIYPNPAWFPEQENRQPAYQGFSEHFQQYLRARLSTIEIPALQKEPEQVLHLEDPYSWSQTMYPGSLLWDRYEIIERLQTTGHSQVVKAWDRQLDRFVAIKRLYLDPAAGEKNIQTFKEGLEREAKILAGIKKHPNIGMVYDVKKEPPTIIMEWIEGKSLDQSWEQGKGLDANKVVELGMALAKALVSIHTQKPPVIHRDIKPENIILRKDGEPVLIDFDVARAAGGVETILPYDEQGRASSFVGTLDYGAPEQFRDPKGVTDRADIYAVGMVLYDALTGRGRAFLRDGAGLSHWEAPPDARIPAPLWLILRDMLADDPHLRPDAQQLSQQLELCFQKLKS